MKGISKTKLIEQDIENTLNDLLKKDNVIIKPQLKSCQDNNYQNKVYNR